MKKRNPIPRFPTMAEKAKARRLASLRSIVAAPKGGPLFEYLRDKSRIELLAHRMSGEGVSNG